MNFFNRLFGATSRIIGRKQFVSKEPSNLELIKIKNPILFIHLPKTAGTSFRKAAERYFGEFKTCKDYGHDSEETSEIVQQWMIKSCDQWHFKKAFEMENYQFISGHFIASRYSQIFGANNSVTFLRDPLQRIVSEYQHFSRYHNYKKEFKEFYKTKQFINKQIKMLHGVPWPALGFIGITEYYAVSLDLFNKQFDVDFLQFEENLSKENIAQRHAIHPDQESEIRELNSEDIRLYEQACRQFEWRAKLAEENKAFTRGMIGGFNNKRLNGWAVYDEGDEPAKVEVAVNGKSAGCVVACDARPQLQALGIRRGGFVGFSLEICSLSQGDEVTAIVTKTGQPLANSPWRYPGS